MRTTGRLLPVLGLTALATCAYANAGATTTALDERALLARADLVFAGVVERVNYAFSDAQGGTRPRIPHTFVTYRIEEVVRGSVTADTITLRFIGGRGDGASFLIPSETPLFDVGDRDVLFVSGNTVSGCPLVDCARGRLRVIQGHVFDDEGQAIERDGTDGLALGAYYDLPEVMTHKVSQTVLTRRDHFEPGESRVAYAADSVGTQLTGDELLGRLHAVARSAPDATVTVRNADPAQPFVLAAFVAEPAPADRARAAAAAHGPVTDQERAEATAMAHSDGDPVIARQ